jgi:hypothetical protein
MKLIDDYAYRLKLGTSTIPNAGLGVFVGIKTAKGTPVCQYKGDIFMPTDNYSFNVEDGRIVGWSSCRVFSTSEIKERYYHTMRTGATQIYTDYVIGHPILRCQIDAHPVFAQSPIGFGGFVNDLRTWKDRQEKEDLTLNNDENRKKALDMGYNVYYFPVPNLPLFTVLALRDLEEGEELLVDYGNSYWELQKEQKELNEKCKKENE